MSRTAPLAIESTNPSDHPAALAWGRLGGGVLASVEMWRRQSRTSPSVYRLIFAGGGRPALFAKRFVAGAPAVERTVYQEILPRLPVTAPRYHGSCTAGDGSAWMFIEDVGDQRLTGDDPGHLALAGRWLGMLHLSGAAEVAAARLPDGGAGRYLGHLRSARDIIRRHLSNPWLTAEDLPVLTGLIGRLDALEARWPRIERACECMPATLVHGDFRPKNVRIRVADGQPALYPFDWEMAGWGVPAADLAGAYLPGPTVQIDTRSYRDVVGGLWRDLDDVMLRGIANVGRIFQALASTDWACASLVVESERHMIRPLTSLRLSDAQLSEAIEEGTGWLAWS